MTSYLINIHHASLIFTIMQIKSRLLIHIHNYANSTWPLTSPKWPLTPMNIHRFYRSITSYPLFKKSIKSVVISSLNYWSIGKKEARKKGKRVDNWEEKKENCKREGEKLEIEGGKVTKCGEDLFFFFFFFFAFHFESDENLFWVYQNGNFLPGKNISRREKNDQEKWLCPLRKICLLRPWVKGHLGVIWDHLHQMGLDMHNKGPLTLVRGPDAKRGVLKNFDPCKTWQKGAQNFWGLNGGGNIFDGLVFVSGPSYNCLWTVPNIGHCIYILY